MNQNRQTQNLSKQLIVFSLIAVSLAGCTSIRVDVFPNKSRNNFILEDNLALTGERTSVFTAKQDSSLLGKVSIQQNLVSGAPQKIEVQIRKGPGFTSVEAPIYESAKTRASLSITRQKDYGTIAGFRFTYRF